MNESIDALMEQAIERNVFPSAGLLVAHREKILHHQHYGQAREGTCFDIASLTKPVATATLAMILIQEGKLKLSDTLHQWLGGARLPVHKKMAVVHLLSHTSGLPSWRPYYREVPMDFVGKKEGKEHIIRSCLNEPIFTEPGKICEYSDLGYILLGEILEQAGGEPLDQLFQEKIAEPQNLKDTFFIKIHDSPFDKTQGRQLTTHDSKQRFSPTEDCPWRGRVLHGEVHDQNAYAMGGVAGHSGLFSTASDLHQFVINLLRCYQGKSEWIAKEIVQQFIDADFRVTSHETRVTPSTYVLGWDTPTFGFSSAGRYFSPHSIGHLGYTGCSIWIDLDKEFWVILLTNRIHPSVANEKIKTFRPRLHNLVWKTFMEAL